MPVEGRDHEVVLLTFTKHVLSYNTGESAAFLPEHAQEFIDQGVAVLGAAPAPSAEDDAPAPGAPEPPHNRRRSKS